MRVRTSTRTRFERFVEPEPTSGCLLWIGRTTKDGYGEFKIGGRYVRAHRFAWELEHGTIQAGSHALHRCDNRPCVRVDHLYLGSNADNVRDRVLRGRTQRIFGEKKPAAKLTDDDVRTIRVRYAEGGVGLRPLAAVFGVTYHLIQLIVKRRAWRHVLAVALLSMTALTALAYTPAPLPTFAPPPRTPTPRPATPTPVATPSPTRTRTPTWSSPATPAPGFPTPTAVSSSSPTRVPTAAPSSTPTPTPTPAPGGLAYKLVYTCNPTSWPAAENPSCSRIQGRWTLVLELRVQPGMTVSVVPQ